MNEMICQIFFKIMKTESGVVDQGMNEIRLAIVELRTW